MTCPRPIRNAEPHPSPTDIVVPPFPIMEGSIVKPDELKAVMDRFVRDLMAGPLQHLMDVERVWDSVFRNVPGVGPLEIDNDPDSEHIGMVRDPEWPAFAGGLVVIGEIEDEVDTITMVLDGLTGAVDDLEEEMETQEACCAASTACCEDLTDRVEALELALLDCGDCSAIADVLSATASCVSGGLTFTRAGMSDSWSSETVALCESLVQFTLTCNGGGSWGLSALPGDFDCTGDSDTVNPCDGSSLSFSLDFGGSCCETTCTIEVTLAPS